MTLNFTNSALSHLPIDPITKNQIRQVRGSMFSLVTPTPVENPQLVSHSDSALQLIGAEEIELELLTQFVSGNSIMEGSVPAAHCYCGHQFGNWAGQLGDGRAIYLGEVLNDSGERWEIQLKGAGKTPYSRHADGRAVLRSSIREFLCSEAMFALGIPTTRAATIITSDTEVVRDIQYDGNPINEKCSIVMRLAPSFIRFGSFEVFKSDISARLGPCAGMDIPFLYTLLDYVIEFQFPQIWNDETLSKPEKYLEFYREVVRLTAVMVAGWQCVGFAHGVLNTDNTSIIGLTIDYGPFGFLDTYDPYFICNGSDHNGRYSFYKQPEVLQWNCMKLAEAISHAVSEDLTKPIHENYYFEVYEDEWIKKMRAKLGLELEDSDDKDLVNQFLITMENTCADMTNTFRILTKVSISDMTVSDEEIEAFMDQTLSHAEAVELKKSRMIIAPDQLRQVERLLTISPAMLQYSGISADFAREEIQKGRALSELENSSVEEFEQKKKELWNLWIESYKNRILKEIENVEDIENFLKERIIKMNSVNPRIVLRNYLAQTAIEKAENGDFTVLNDLLEKLLSPFNEETDMSNYTTLPPSWSIDLCVTCSS